MKIGSQLKLSMPVSSDLIEPLENYFFESTPSPWVLLQETASDPYFLMGYFENEYNGQIASENLLRTFPNIQNKFKKEWLNQIDWQDAYKSFVKPWNDRLLYWIPLWAKNKYSPTEGSRQSTIYLDAGMAFGTGSHETTQLCASRLVDFYTDTNSHVSSGLNCRIVDAGCGSGILALSAASLGYRNIHAFDNDPSAIEVCHENLLHNPTLNSIKFSVADLDSGLKENEVDFLMANIETDILISFIEPIIKSLKENAILVLSGILRTEIKLLEKYYLKSFKRLRPHSRLIYDSRDKGEWSDLMIKIIACEDEKNI